MMERNPPLKFLDTVLPPYGWRLRKKVADDPSFRMRELVAPSPFFSREVRPKRTYVCVHQVARFLLSRAGCRAPFCSFPGQFAAYKPEKRSRFFGFPCPGILSQQRDDEAPLFPQLLPLFPSGSMHLQSILEGEASFLSSSLPSRVAMRLISSPSRRREVAPFFPPTTVLFFLGR